MNPDSQAPSKPDEAFPVRLTPEAVAYAKQQRERLGKPTAALRIGVRGGGCAGLTYVTEYTEDAPRERDLVAECDGLALYVDKRSVAFIQGSEIRYERTLMYQGLKWANPQQETSCGCGQTFSVRQPGSPRRRELKTTG